MRSMSNAETEMLNDDLLDGWLDVPAWADFLHGPLVQRPGLERSRDMSLAAANSGSPPEAHVELDTSPPPSENVSATQSAARKRRGHTKSRLGCIMCKKRKVKCQETRPSCGNCIKRGLQCKYPPMPSDIPNNALIRQTTNHPRPTVGLTCGPNLYSGNDMRLFHHFLIAKSVLIPQKDETIWVREIPSLVHQYDYLMYAVLALAASHLSIFTEGTQTQVSLSHRQKAIKCLEQAFSNSSTVYKDAHIMLATSHLLAFNASYLPDALLDQVISLRSCSMMFQFIVKNQIQGIFPTISKMPSGASHMNLDNFYLLDQALVTGALESIIRFARVLAISMSHTIEKAIVAQLITVVHSLLGSLPDRSSSSSPTIESTDATELSAEVSGVDDTTEDHEKSNILLHPFLPSTLSVTFEDIDLENITTIPPDKVLDPICSFRSLMGTFGIFSNWPQDSLMELFSPTNTFGTLTLIFFIGIRFVVAPLSAPASISQVPIAATVDWGERLVRSLERNNAAHAQYADWPGNVIKCLRCCLDEKKTLTIADTFDVVMKDPGALMEGRARKPTWKW